MGTIAKLRLQVIATGLVLAAAAGAQTLWTGAEHRTDHAMAADPLQNRVVLFGGDRGGPAASVLGNDTWVRSASGWREVLVRRPPEPRAQHALGVAAGRVVLFGGVTAQGVVGDTWVFEQSAWTRLSPALAPGARRGHAIASDFGRGVLVLFGGNDGVNDLDDTWEFDGLAWRQIATATRPARRARHAMTWDASRNRVMLFGGSGGAALQDTWEYDGVDWRQRAAAASPSARAAAAIAFDPTQRAVVLFGGGDDETWVWDEAAVRWRMRTPATRPAARSGHAFAYAFDPELGTVCVELLGGAGASELAPGPWVWDGSDWRYRGIAGASPFAAGQLAYDALRARIVTFVQAGGVGATWEHDGGRWLRRTPVPSPRQRAGHALAYDIARGRTVMFGGVDSVWLNDTHEWDGSAWHVRSPATTPTAVHSAALAYDARRARIVLFGGNASGAASNQTWLWDGSDWTRRLPSRSPAARFGHAIEYDSVRERIVLFGGRDVASFGDTWEWDGSDWTQRTPPLSPPARHGHGLAYDPVRERTVLFGDATAVRRDTWEWDGTLWHDRGPSPAPALVAGAPHTDGFAFDRARGVAVFAGTVLAGSGPDGNLVDTWRYRAASLARFEPFGTACRGSAGPPALSSPGLPWLGAPIELVVTNLPPASAPLLLLGFSDTVFGAFALPLDMGAFGMPGCRLYVSVDATFAMPPTGRLSLLIPNLPSLVGARFFGQAFVIDPPANGIGTLSNAAAATIGAK